jgi:RND superfamily putative drug exporter
MDASIDGTPPSPPPPPSPTRPRRPLTERLCAWSARHRRAVVAGWLALVAAAVVVGQLVQVKEVGFDDFPGESTRAQRMLADAGVEVQPAETVMVSATGAGLNVDSPEVRAAVTDVVAAVDRFPRAVDVRSPLDEANAAQVSADRRSALVLFKVAGPEADAAAAVGPIAAAVADVRRAHPGVRIDQAGELSIGNALDDALGDDFRRAEYSSVPITLAILLVAFGSLVAAGIPVLLAVTAVMAALGLTSALSAAVPTTETASSVILLIGMAVGVDYSLFYLRRIREERAAGAAVTAAIATAAATSGRAVVVSGLTVMISMAGLFLAGVDTLDGVAVGTILVVGVAVIGSVTVLPALVALLGRGVEAGRLPLIGRRGARGEGSAAWGWMVERVLRRPLLLGGLAAALLVALALPATGMRTVAPGLDGISRDLPELRALDRIEAAFPGGPDPALVVVRAADAGAPAVRRALADLRERALATGRLHDPIAVTPVGARLALVSVPMDGTGTDEASEAALRVLRGEVVPATVGRLPGVEAAVTGTTAANHDFGAALSSREPLVFGFVLGLAFLLLLVVFRSVAIPVTAILLNLLSVGAAYGILTLVFQDGRFEGLLGYESIGGVVVWLPLFLFVILFGLSMDYHVFILSRVREARDRGATTRAAVAHGIRSTAGVVTSAAAVMIAVFAVFATLSVIELKMMGIGLAAAILIDATIVRGVLLPAAMRLLGEGNWWLPRWLGWLPRLRLDAPAPVAQPVGQPEAAPAGAGG